ncbi:MAG: Sua5/YciO/YrdC/YwlC family protein [Gammaproteobacteria bacterium]|jgi:L-threonylcarbamoyladenylate synthase
MNNWHIREALRQLAAGGIIAYPTETVYGLGCNPWDGTAVLRLLALKRRHLEQGVILIADEFARLEPLLFPVSSPVRRRVTTPRSRPVSWVLPCTPEIPEWLRGNHPSLAVRLATHPIAIELCRQWEGPLVSTSANIHGRAPARSPLAVRKAFGNRLDYILHGSCGSGRPSEIRDALSGRILRNAGGQG